MKILTLRLSGMGDCEKKKPLWVTSVQVARLEFTILRKAKIQREVNFIPGGYIKRTSSGGIKLTLTYASEERGVGNGQICADFISMN
jgi:hypothetical protein